MVIENDIYIIIGKTKYKMKIPANIQIEADHVNVEINNKRFKLKEKGGCKSGGSGGTCCGKHH